MEKRTRILLLSSLIIVSALAIAIVFQLGRQNRNHDTEFDESVFIDLVLKHEFWLPKPPSSGQLEKILSIMTDPREHGTIYILNDGGEIRRQRWNRCVTIDLDRERPQDRMHAIAILYREMEYACGEDFEFQISPPAVGLEDSAHPTIGDLRILRG